MSDESGRYECSKCGSLEFIIYVNYGNLLFACSHCGRFVSPADIKGESNDEN